MRNYTASPPFVKPIFTEGVPVRSWAGSAYVPADPTTLANREAAAMRIAAKRHLLRGNFRKWSQMVKAAEILEQTKEQI
jgi:hypothetical protein